MCASDDPLPVRDFLIVAFGSASAATYRLRATPNDDGTRFSLTGTDGEELGDRVLTAAQLASDCLGWLLLAITTQTP